MVVLRLHLSVREKDGIFSPFAQTVRYRVRIQPVASFDEDCPGPEIQNGLAAGRLIVKRRDAAAGEHFRLRDVRRDKLAARENVLF